MAVEARKPGACVLCGAAPTPHLVHYIDTAISIFFDRSLRRALSLLVTLFTPLVRFLTTFGTYGFFQISDMLGVAKFHNEPLSNDVSRTSVMFNEAKKRGIPMQLITFLGKPISYSRAKLPICKGSSKLTWHYFEHLPIPPWREAPLTRNLDNKSELKELFEKKGVCVPRGKACFFYTSALATFRKLGTPVIVKPLEGSRARHTRVNVTTEAELLDAFKVATQICPVAMIEEYVLGDVHRATCIGGRLVAVMRFVRPTIEADGYSTLNELRATYNKRTHLPHVEPLEDNDLFVITARHQGYETSDIPAAGTLIRLAEFSERTNGGYNEDLTDTIPEKTRAAIENAARISGLAVVGFDIISRDITNDEEPIRFLEANTAPFIEIHHTPTFGTPRNVAGALWDLWVTT